MPPDNPFKQSEDEYFVLRGKLELGRITQSQFEAALHDLMLEDNQGQYWMLGADSGKWFMHDGQVWVEADPNAPGVVAKRLAPSRPTTIPRENVQSPPVSAPLQAASPTTSGETETKKVPGFFRTGCTALLALMVVIVAIAAALYFRVPQQFGLFGTTPERILSTTPDREAAATLKDEAVKTGIDTRGMDFYVLPYKDKPGNVAYVTLDASKGFNFKSGSRDPMVDYLNQFANSPAVKKYDLQRIAIEYKSPSGASLLSMTAPVAAINNYAQGKITREQFLKQIDGQANWVEFYRQALK